MPKVEHVVRWAVDEYVFWHTQPTSVCSRAPLLRMLMLPRPRFPYLLSLCLERLILPTSFRKEAALRVRIDRNPILSISSKLRRPSFAMTIDRPAHPSIQPRAKKEVQKGKAAASAVSQFSLDIPSLPPPLSNRSDVGRPTNPNCTAAEKERTNAREGRQRQPEPAALARCVARSRRP